MSRAPLFLCDSSMSRASCNRWLITGWPGLCSSWPSAEAHWLFHTTWSPKTRPPKPVTKWKQRTRPQLLCPVKVPMNHIMSFYSSHSSLTVFLNVAMWFFSPLCLAAKVKQYIKDSVSSQNSTFTLRHLASLEKKLAKHFQVNDFRSLEQGNFLEFLVKHIQVCIIFLFS